MFHSGHSMLSEANLGKPCGVREIRKQEVERNGIYFHLKKEREVAINNAELANSKSLY